MGLTKLIWNLLKKEDNNKIFKKFKFKWLLWIAASSISIFKSFESYERLKHMHTSKFDANQIFEVWRIEKSYKEDFTTRNCHMPQCREWSTLTCQSVVKHAIVIIIFHQLWLNSSIKLLIFSILNKNSIKLLWWYFAYWKGPHFFIEVSCF